MMMLSSIVLMRAATLSDPEVDAYNARMAVQNIGPKYNFTSDNVLLEGAKVVRDMGSNTYKFTMNPSGGSYGITVPSGVTNLAQFARNEPSYRAMFDLAGINNYVFWCYTFATPNNWDWTNGFTAAEQAAEYNEIHALAVHFLTQYNGTGKNFYIGHWEGDWSVGVNSSDPANSNPSPTAVQGMIDWLNIRQKAVDDAKAAIPHSNVNVYCYTEVNRVVDAYKNPPASNQRVINAVVPNVPNLDFVSWSSYDIQGMSPAEIKFYLNYAESFLPAAKSAVIPGKRIFIGEFGYGQYPEAVQAPMIAAYSKTLFEWGCPFALYWTLYDNDLSDGATFNLIDPAGTKTANYWLYRRYLNAAKLRLLEFKQDNGRLPTNAEFQTIAASLLATQLTEPVALTVSNRPAVVADQQSAILSGTLLQGVYGDENARMYLCWGTGDGGEALDDWQHVVDLGVNTRAGASVFTHRLNGLTPHTTHYYRFFASNNSGTSWAAATGSFHTMDVHTFTPTTSGTYSWNQVENWNSYGVPVGGATTGVTIFENTSVAAGSGALAIEGDPSTLTLNALSLNGLGPDATSAATVSVGTAGNTWTLGGNSPAVFLNGNRNTHSLHVTVHPNLELAEDATFQGHGSAAFTFSGSITGAKSLIKTGGSSLALSGAGSSYSGGLHVKEGTLTCNTSSAFGSGTVYLGDTTGGASATLCGFSSSATTSAPIIVQAGSTGTKTIRNPSFGSTNFLGNLTLNHDVTLDGGTANAAFSIFKTGSLSGPGNIAVRNTGNGATVILQHPNSSGYTGTVTVHNGTLRLANASALNSANEVRVDDGATLDVRSNVTIAGLNDITGSGGTVVNNGAAATRTLKLGGSGSYYFNGAISDGASADRIMSLIKSGVGFQVLSGASSFSGGTTIDGGILELNSASALGTGGVTLSGAAEQLLLAASATYTNSISINGGSGISGQGLIDTDRGGNATLGAATITITAPPGVGNAGHFGSHSSGSLTVRSYINSTVTVDWRRNNGVFSGGGNYTNFRIRSGTVKLGAHNGLAASATLNIGANSGGGTFDLAGYNQTLVAITKAANPATITNSGSAVSTLTTTGTGSFGGTITDGSSPVALNVSGGTLTLAGACSYTGGTTISNGTLVLESSGSLSSNSAIRIAAGARLNTTAVASFALPVSRNVIFDINPDGSGSAGRVVAANLDITGARVAFNVTGTLDDPAYVLASYTGKTGTAFAVVTPPAGYTVDYNYDSGTKIALVQGAGTNASLYGLALSDGALSPAFASDITSYSTSVPNTTDSLVVTPIAADGSATIMINGETVAAGSPSGRISLAVGSNVITTVVTAQDGATARTYTITVTRLASTNANLAGLALDGGTLSPAFDSGITSYTAGVPNATASLFVTPAVDDSTATVTVNGTPVVSGSPSAPLGLVVGTNVITTTVTAQDGVTTKTYTVTVTRAAITANHTFTQTAAGTHAWNAAENWDVNGVPTGSANVALTFFPDTVTALAGNAYTINADPATLVLNTLTLSGLGAAEATASAVVNIGTTGNVWTFDGEAPTVNLSALRNTAKDLFYNVKPNLVINQGITFTGNGTAGSSFNGFMFNGAVSGLGSLTKSGTSRLTLSSNNSYSGGTVFSGGQLWLGSGGSLGTGAVMIHGAARQLMVTSNATLDNRLTLSAGTGAGTSAQGLIDAGNFAFTLGGAIDITATPQFGGHFGSSGGTLAVNGTITSSVPVVSRRGTVIFGGTGSSYGSLSVASGTVKLAANDGLATSAMLEIGTQSAAAFDLAGYNQTLAGITRSINAATITNSASSMSTLTTTGASSFGGVIQDGVTGKTALMVNGGSLTLTAANTYSGGTTIREGQLGLGVGGSIANSASVRIAAGATLDSSAKPSLSLAPGQPVTIGLDGGGTGASGRIKAAGLDIRNAVVNFDVTGTLDDAVYVLASYTSRTGDAFASVDLPEGYTLDYSHASGTQIALVATRFHLWRQEHFPGSTAASGPGADLAMPLGDGVPNLMKFALGLNPRVASAMPGILARSGENLLFTYVPGVEAVADGMIFTVQSSETLAPDDWKSDQVDQGFIGTGGVPVTATIPMRPGNRRFIRLLISYHPSP